MSQDLEIIYVYESETVHSYEGDIVGGLVPIRVGEATIRLRLVDRSGLKAVFEDLFWPAGQPDFIQWELIADDLIEIYDHNQSYLQRGNFSFVPRVRSEGGRVHAAPDPTIINTDIPGGTAAQAATIGRAA